MRSWSYKTDVLIIRGKDTRDSSLLSTTQSETDQDPTEPSQERTRHPHILPSLCSVQFSLSVVSDSLWPHGLQHARSPCPSSTLRVYSNSRPLNRWCHPTTLSSVFPFSSCLQSLPASGSFPMNQVAKYFCIRWPKYWSFSFSISPSNEYI